MDHLKLIGAVGVGVACVQVRHGYIKKKKRKKSSCFQESLVPSFF